jgi:hypothetical protein
VILGGMIAKIMPPVANTNMWAWASRFDKDGDLWRPPPPPLYGDQAEPLQLLKPIPLAPSGHSLGRHGGVRQGERHAAAFPMPIEYVQRNPIGGNAAGLCEPLDPHPRHPHEMLLLLLLDFSRYNGSHLLQPSRPPEGGRVEAQAGGIEGVAPYVAP